MYREYKLKPAVWHEKPLEFAWDQDSGELRGRDAARVLDLVAVAVKDGGVVTHPYPTTYAIRDPLHSPTEMAAVLGQFWLLTDDLMAALPGHDEDDLLYEVEEDGTEHVSRIQPLE